MSRRVLVTGGASGLGAAFVAEFLKRGDRVVIADLQAPVDPALVDGAEQIKLDVTSERTGRRRIDVLTKRTMRPLYDRQQRGFAARIFAMTEEKA